MKKCVGLSTARPGSYTLEIEFLERLFMAEKRRPQHSASDIFAFPITSEMGRVCARLAKFIDLPIRIAPLRPLTIRSFVAGMAFIMIVPPQRLYENKSSLVLYFYVGR